MRRKETRTDASNLERQRDAPTQQRTFPKRSGRNHAQLNAQIAPELPPVTIRCAGSFVILNSASTTDRMSRSRKEAYVPSTVSYSSDRRSGLVSPASSEPPRWWTSPGWEDVKSGSRLPGVTKTAIVVGISPAWMRLSRVTWPWGKGSWGPVSVGRFPS